MAGQVEVWAAVRLIVQLLQRGEVGEAQGLLDASECTCPNGEIWRGVYDEGGEYYKVPEWVSMRVCVSLEGVWFFDRANLG